MANYESLLRYISYFEEKGKEIYTFHPPENTESGTIHLGYYEYNEGFHDFIKDFYHSDLSHHNYLEFLEENVPDQDYIEVIATANIELLSAILTFYVRADRFSEGSWAASLKEQIFLKILKRLKELVKN